ncbi:DUF1918 domain-containing protein [Hoyosella sp. G463]|uniref:DUF1918 domain-containing protein n=1 Tax=Lolliginicoccus lacisalsi TaxID=2742202 RepID=A0A927JE27_9ACTN|nr:MULTISPECIES: DUF1918 domain-containing protein [Lolliginicoccus]MBD8507120.1 DUF1918 domain-containing protein [Lolliginicoccus lacisalsi]
MHAVIGDHLHIKSATVGRPEQDCEVLEVRGPSGEPPYRVRFDDGHESLLFPGTDCLVEHRD